MKANTPIMAEINITPFTDVVLVLLIIFMVATPLIYQNSVRVNLPSTKTKEVSDTPREMTVLITASGDAYCNNTAYPLTNKDAVADLQNIMSGRMGASKESTVYIKGDKAARYEHIARIVDMAKIASAKRVLLATENER